MALDRFKKTMRLKLDKMLRTKQQNEEFERALNLYHEGNYVQAKDLFKRLVDDEDDIEANYYYAKCCQLDTTVKYNVRHFYNAMEYCANNEYVPAFYEAAKILETEGFFDKPYDLPMSLYEKGAKRNCPKCQYELGVHYLNGRLVNKNINQAIKWLSQSAQNNHSEAAYLLATSYRSGNNIDKDDEKATQYYGIAANLGHKDAQAYYGYALENGLGIDKNIENAISWYKRAAKQNQMNAQYRLGKIYKYGNGVPVDYKQASEYLYAAANQKHNHAIIEYAKMCSDGTYFKKNDLVAMNWYLKAMNNNPTNEQYKEIYYQLVMIFLDMKSEEFDIYDAKRYYHLALELGENRVKQFDSLISYLDTEAKKYFLQAQKLDEANDPSCVKYYNTAGYSGLSEAYVYAGKIFENGKYGKVHLDKAFEKYKLAVHGENPWGNECLGDLYYEGKGIEKDIDKAIEYYQYACDHGQTKPLQRLVVQLRSRNDFDHAHKYTILLANAGNDDASIQACYSLGIHYESENEALSRKYFMKAIEHGHAEAILRKVDDYATSFEMKKEWLERLSNDQRANYQLYVLMKDHDEEYAMNCLKFASEKGHFDACYDMGMVHYEKEEFENAITYFETSKTTKSYVHLGNMHKDGIYYSKDWKKAKFCYLNGLYAYGCDAKDIMFIINEIIHEKFEDVKLFYIKGLNDLVHKGIYNHFFVETLINYNNDEAKQLAFDYQKQLALNGNAEACYYLGMTYYKGKYNHKISINDAYIYLKMAAEGGHVEAMYQLGYLMFFEKYTVDQKEVDKKMDEYSSYLYDTYGKYNNIAKKEALKYKDKEFVEGKIDDIIFKNYPFGTLEDVKYDLDKMVVNVHELVFKAKDYDEQYFENQKLSSFLYTQKYFDSKYKNFDSYEAYDWLEKAVEHNHAGAMVLIGKYNINAEGYEERVFARELLERAAKLGNEEAKEILKKNPR